MVEQGNPADLDPFWSTVHRRQPDVDIVLLPDVAPDDSPLPPADPGLLASVPAALDAWVTTFWDRISPEVPERPPTSRWAAGTVPEALERSAMAALEDVADTDGRRAVSAAAELLREDGFDGVVPPTGMPRVLASRVRDEQTQEVQVVWVPANGRLALSVRWTPVVVGRDAADQALEETT